MVDTELFIGLAGIAGVFVGFGALIAVRSSGPTEPAEVAPMRAVVAIGMLAITGALAPVTFGSFDLAPHQVWWLSSAVLFGGWLAIWGVSARTPEYRGSWAAEVDTVRSGARPLWLTAAGSVVYVTYVAAVMLTPVVILVGVAPALESALYVAAIVLVLLGAGWSLMGLVFRPRSPTGA